MRVYDSSQPWRYLLEITQAISARLDLDSVLDRALRYAVEFVNGNAGLIALRASEVESFRFVARYGIEPTLLSLFRPLLTEIPLTIEHDRTPRWRFPELELKFEGVMRHPVLYDDHARRFRYVMALPLIASERLIGIIYVFRPPRAAAFTVLDENALEQFAAHVTLAIEHARVYEEAARRAQELDAVIEASANGFFIANREGKLWRVNRAFEQWTGWTREHAYGKPVADVLRLTDARGQLLSLPAFSQNNAPSSTTDGFVKRRDGTRGAFVHVVLTPQFDDAGQLFSLIGNVVDVTALREASDLQTAFLAGISHDLKTPLALIRGYAETLRRPDVNWNEHSRDASLGVIQDEAEHLTDLVNSLLDAAQLQRGELPLQKNRVRVDELARTLVERFRALNPEYEWQTDFPDEYPAVAADAQRIRQILTNLLSNAVKYSPRKTRITVGGWIENERVGVVVRDEGAGVPLEEQPRLFERFQRGRARQHQRSEGAGLGLYLSRAIVEQHGGKIWMENLPERGAAFYFTLPRETTKDD